MKIHLEHRQKDRTHQLCCVACQHSFSSDKLRSLLCHDSGAIVGDLCNDCLQKGNNHIQQQLKVRSIELFKQQPIEVNSLSAYRQALELSELANQSLTIPPFYLRWWQQLIGFAAETQSLEMARREPIDCRYRQPKPLKITFLTEEPAIGTDN
jgi:hypothetical protein